MIGISNARQPSQWVDNQTLLDGYFGDGFPCARRLVTIEELAAEFVVRSEKNATQAITKFEAEPITVVPDNSPGACTEIASMPPTAHLDVAVLASVLGRCKKSIQRAVRRGELPQPFKFMGRHVWLAGKIVEHLQKLQDEALRQADRRDRKIEEQMRGR